MTRILLLSLLALATIAACELGQTAAPTATPPPQVVQQPNQPIAPATVPPGTFVKPTINPEMTEVRIEETLLNIQIASGLPQGGQISNPHIDLRPDNLADITATLTTGILSVQPKATVKLSAQDGRIVIDVLNVDVSGVGLPSSLVEPQIAEIKRNAETQLNQQFAELESSTGLKLQTITTTDNALILRFAP